MRDVGAALEAVGAKHSNSTASSLGKNFSAVAPPLLTALRKSMAMDAFSSGGAALPRCFPYVAGIKECGELPHAASNRE